MKRRRVSPTTAILRRLRRRCETSRGLGQLVTGSDGYHDIAWMIAQLPVLVAKDAEQMSPIQLCTGPQARAMLRCMQLRRLNKSAYETFMAFINRWLPYYEQVKDMIKERVLLEAIHPPSFWSSIDTYEGFVCALVMNQVPPVSTGGFASYRQYPRATTSAGSLAAPGARQSVLASGIYARDLWHLIANQLNSSSPTGAWTRDDYFEVFLKYTAMPTYMVILRHVETNVLEQFQIFVDAHPVSLPSERSVAHRQVALKTEFLATLLARRRQTTDIMERDFENEEVGCRTWFFWTLELEDSEAECSEALSLII